MSFHQLPPFHKALVINYLSMSRTILNAPSWYLNDIARKRLREQIKELVS